MRNKPISKRLRVQRAIQSISNLVAYYPLNEVEGSAAHSRHPHPTVSGTDRDGTIIGATIDQPGKAGRCFSLDGVNDSIDLGTFDPSTGDLTISMLYKTDSVNGTRCLIGKRDDWADASGNRWILARSDADGKIHFERWGGGVAFNQDLVSGSWQHLVITHDYSTQAKLYINGELVDTQGGFTYGTKADANLYIGQNGQDGEYMNMECQHVAFYGKVLTAEEVKKIYQSL